MPVIKLLLLCLFFFPVQVIQAEDSGLAEFSREKLPLTFRGFPCTIDCSGHKAGYQWAERKSIDREENCGGKSNSFIEGCTAWVRAQRQEDSNAPEPPSSLPEND